MTDSPVRAKVTVKYAQTLDGRIATSGGESKWISGEGSRRRAHALRAGHDAVLVGAGTVLADDPRLTVRLAEGRSPRRIVVDGRLRVPPGARVFEGEGTIVATTEKAPKDRLESFRDLPVRVVQLPEAGEGQVDLKCLFETLPRMGIQSVLVEGGGGIITSILRNRLADRMVVFIAPKVIGKGTEAIGDLGISEMNKALSFCDYAFEIQGEDVTFDGVPSWPSE